MNRLILIEQRLERVKNVGNLQLEQLQRLYDRRSIAELYRERQIVLHVHGIVYDSSRWCLTVEYMEGNPISGRCGRAHEYRISVSISIGKLPDFPDPSVSVVRLKPLDQCDMLALDAFEQGRNLSSEVVWRLTYRKLQALIDASGIKNNKGRDKKIEGDPQRLDNLAHVNRKVPDGIRKFIADVTRVSSIWLRNDDIVLEFPEFFYSGFEVRQAFFGPLYSTIGII
jgi:hypothetical protein